MWYPYPRSNAIFRFLNCAFIQFRPDHTNVINERTKPRTRYVEDWEIEEILALPSPRSKGGVKLIQAYIRLKLLTGLRKSDLLRLKMVDLKEDGIHVTTRKTGKPIIYDWSDDLKNTIELIRGLNKRDITVHVFANRKGLPYIDEKTGNTSAWDSMWQRFMKRVLDETKIEQRFTEHDLRAKCASDADSLEHAQKLLAHADSRITDKIYRRKPERIKPANFYSTNEDL